MGAASIPVSASPAPGRVAVREGLILAVATVLVLLPFINRAYHIDDPLFIWAAQHVRAHPLNPYGFTVNWYSKQQPMYTLTENPPLACYFIAGASLLVGWAEPGLHAAFLLPAIGVVLGTWRLARRFCSRPALAALLALVTPVFVISGSTVMCDMLMLCFWVWAVELWLMAGEAPPAPRRGRAVLAAAGAAVLVSAAAMTKYFGISLVPLLLVDGLLRRRWRLLPALLVPIAAVIAYQVWTGHLYGHGFRDGLLFEPIKFIGLHRRNVARPPAKMIIGLLSFSGGCLLPAMFLGALLLSRAWRWLGVAFFIGVVLTLRFSDVTVAQGVFLPNRADPSTWIFRRELAIQIAFFSVGGLAVIALLIVELRRRHDADGWLLGLWLAGTLVFAGFVNWSINGRSILPAAPVLAIILVRRIDAAWRAAGSARSKGARPLSPWALRWVVPMLLSGALAMAAAYADSSVADAERTAASRITLRYGHGPGRLWNQGHWGFQYYMERGGSLEIIKEDVRLEPGDLMALPFNNTDVHPLPESSVVIADSFNLPVMPWLSVQSGYTGAGFYSDIWGSAAFVFGPAEPQRYIVEQVIQPVRGSL